MAADGVLYGATASLGLGGATALALGGDLDGDGADDLVALGVAGGGGVGWVVSGGAAVGASGDISATAGAWLTGQASYPLTHVAGPLADATGDGRADLLVGGSSGGGVGSAVGRVWLLDGAAATGAIDLSAAYTARFDGDSANDLVRLAAAADLDGDGFPDLAFTGVYDSYLIGSLTDAYTGNVSVVSGAGGWAGAYTAGDASDQIHGSEPSDFLGQSLAAADFDGDGYADLAVGAPGDDGAADNAGAVYVFPGNLRLTWSGDSADDAATVVVEGHTASLALGNDPIPTPGDHAGAGTASLALASSVSGEAWVFFDVAGRSGRVAVTDADTAWSGTPSSFATALASASDLDADGVADLAIGASGDDTTGADAGAVFLFRGGAWPSALTSADADASFYGSNPGDALGAGLAAGGDLDADGLHDLILGAPGDDTLATNGGAAWVMRGR